MSAAAIFVIALLNALYVLLMRHVENQREAQQATSRIAIGIARSLRWIPVVLAVLAAIVVHELPALYLSIVELYVLYLLLKRLVTSWGWLHGAETAPLSPWHTILWWEARRLPYNAILVVFGWFGVVTVAGAASGLDGDVTAWQLGDLVVPLILANLGYMLGWTTELVVNAVRGREVSRIGPALFRFALGLSAIVVFAPAVVFVANFILNREI